MTRLVLAVGLIVMALTACNRDRPVSVPSDVALDLHILFPDPDPARSDRAARAGIPLDAPSASRERSIADLVDRIEAKAFEILLPESTAVLRATASTEVAHGATQFRLVLKVPLADLYRIEVSASGTGSGQGSGDEPGIVFTGDALLPLVTAGEQGPVTIEMRFLVPHLQLEVEPFEGYTLRWTPIPEAIRYRLKAIPPAPESPVEIVTARTDTTIAFPPGLLAAREAALVADGVTDRAADGRPSSPALGPTSWRVRAEFSDSLFSAFSDSVVAIVPGPIAPGSVRDLRVIAVAPRAVTLAWTAPGDDGFRGRAVSYDLRFALSEISPLTWTRAQPVRPLPDPSSAGETDSVTIRGLEPETRYYFALTARDDAGLESSLSNDVSAKTGIEPPEAPVALRATALSSDSIRLTWFDRALNEEIYEIERRGPLDTLFLPRATLQGSFHDSVRYVDEGLQARSVYAYRVRARNAGGASEYAEAEIRTRMEPPFLFPPEARSPNLVVISWRFPEPDPGGFLLERARGTEPFVEIARPDSSARSFRDDQVLPLTRYAYRIRAYEENEITAYSTTRSVTTPDYAPICLVSPPAIAFDTLTVGESADSDFTIRNTGGGVLSGNVSLSCIDFVLLSGAGQYSLRTGESRVCTVRYQPIAAGRDSCAVGLGSTFCTAVPLTGAALPPPLCFLSPQAIDFGVRAAGTHTDSTFVVRNIGGGSLDGVMTLGQGCSEFSFLSGGGAFHLGPQESLRVAIRFAPTSGGLKECGISTGASGCPSVELFGESLLPPLCEVSTRSLDFGRVDLGESVDRSFEITNIGGGILSGAVEQRCGAFETVLGSGTYTLAAGESRSVTIRFTPQESGLQNCDFATGSACQAVTTEGTGLLPDDHWSAQFGPNTQGLNGPCAALAADASVLYAGGSFSLAGTFTVNGIARWNGSSWRPLGSGLQGESPRALALGFFNGLLIAGGDFTGAGGQGAFSIAAWNGSTARWSSLGNGVNGPVLALAEYDGALFAGGMFLRAGEDTQAAYLARWDSTAWTHVGSGLDDQVNALTVFRGRLIAGGRFLSAGGPVVNHVAAWNGLEWQPLGAGIGSGSVDEVFALTIWNDQLVAGGSFFEAGGAFAGNVAVWDGSSWAPLGDGFADRVFGLTVYQGDLIATGAFLSSGDAPVQRIARFNGTSWEPLGSGLGAAAASPFGLALSPFGASLYVGGGFTEAGEKPSLYIARWDEE